MVILPYVFLMNTSHNKNRVIEHGWTNVFNNILGRKLTPFNHSTDAASANPKEAPSKNGKKHDNDETDDQHARKNSPENERGRGQGEETDSTKNTPEQKDDKIKNSKVCSVKTNKMNDLGRDRTAKCKQNVFTTQSSGYFPEGNKSTIVSEPSHSGIITGTNNGDLIEAERLVLKMLEYIKDEEKYSEYFKQLVSHVYSSKYGKIHPELCLHDDSLPNSVPEASSPTNPSHSQGTSSTSLQQRRKFRSMTEMNATDHYNINEQHHLTSEAKDRVANRQKLLTKIVSTNCRNQKKIEIWRVKQLINVEADYIKIKRLNY